MYRHGGNVGDMTWTAETNFWLPQPLEALNFVITDLVPFEQIFERALGQKPKNDIDLLYSQIFLYSLARGPNMNNVGSARVPDAK